MKLPARLPCHESREWVVLDLIALRKHVLQRLFLSCEKKIEYISNLHVIGLGPLNEPNQNLFFVPCSFTFTDLSDSRRNQKNPRTES